MMKSHSHKRQASPSSGGVSSYLHAGGKIGVLLEVRCESDFVARSDDFRELIHDIAMHIAATDPKFIRKEDVAPQVLEHQRNTYRTQAAGAGMPPHVIEQIVEGKTNKFYEKVCLYEQPFIKDQTTSISQLIASKAGKLGEEIVVRRFARFKVEASDSASTDDSDRHPEEGDETGVTANKPKGPTAGSGFAAAKPDLV
jgi:elongation factor Ts